MDILVDATVPLANMLGYADVLEVFAPGSAKHTLKFDHYAQTSPEKPEPPLRPAAAIS